MQEKKTALEEMWAKQCILPEDVDYNLWDKQRVAIQTLSYTTKRCFFTVDVVKERYDFASRYFSDIFGYKLSWIENIQHHGDILEERIHPDDREQILDRQIKHSRFIYSLPTEDRNNYRTLYQFRLLNRKNNYIQVISRQQVFQTDRNGKAWIILGSMEIAPDQLYTGKIKYIVENLKTGEIFNPEESSPIIHSLTPKEREILQLIRQGYLSKEIAYLLHISIHTVNNHRKNILSKLKVDNIIEALNLTNKTL